jgi:hypothetical protein
MITANAAGIPARYVANEAHAFGEIWLPDAGWIRVDLGGASPELDIANAGDKTLYRPRGEDPFPKPRAYSENYTRLRGAIQGLSPSQVADGRGRATPPPVGAAADPTSTDPVAAPQTGLVRPRPPATGKKVIRLALDLVEGEGFRGETLRVAGHAVGAPEGLRVDIYLSPEGTAGQGARVVGQATIDKAGAFAIRIEIPQDMPLGRHEVYALTPGNSDFAPAVSD